MCLPPSTLPSSLSPFFSPSLPLSALDSLINVFHIKLLDILQTIASSMSSLLQILWKALAEHHRSLIEPSAVRGRRMDSGVTGNILPDHRRRCFLFSLNRCWTLCDECQQLIIIMILVTRDVESSRTDDELTGADIPYTVLPNNWFESGTESHRTKSHNMKSGKNPTVWKSREN